MDHLNSVTSEDGAKSPASLTPLTDALCEQLFRDGGPVRKVTWVCSEDSAAQIADLARKLEADRAELIATLREYHEATEANNEIAREILEGRGPRTWEAQNIHSRWIQAAKAAETILSRLSETPATTEGDCFQGRAAVEKAKHEKA